MIQPLKNESCALTDEEVATKVLDGETELFEIIMRRHNRRLFRVTRSILRNDAESEDVVQDAYVRAYAHLGSFEGRSKFATWLTRIAVHEALSRKRRDCRTGPMEVEVLAEGDPRHFSEQTTRSPEQQAIDGQLRDLIETAIDRLPLHYRTVFVLRDVQGMDTAETAESLGIQEQAVKTRLHRARKVLKGLLEFHVGCADKAFNFLGARCDRIVAAVLARISETSRADCEHELRVPSLAETFPKLPTQYR
jgi:RNA polymerase sigma-70 factor, ECF subfamily